MGGPERWAEAEEARLFALISDGMTDPEAADALGVPVWQVYRRRTQRGWPPGGDGGMLGLAQVNRLMGHRLTDRRAFRWVSTGLVPGRIRPHAGRYQMYVTHNDLMAWLESPDSWPHWDPARITDPDTRAWAMLVRNEYPGRSGAQACASCGGIR